MIIDSPDGVETAHAFDTPVFITGLPRSGTSMVAGLCAACGLWLGETVPPGPENPKGFFENKYIREHIIKTTLRDLGADIVGVRTLPYLATLPALPDLKSRLRAALNAEGYDASVPWGYKDAKLSLLWPQWATHFPDATWIIVHRNVEGFIDSCLRTWFMKWHSPSRDFWRAMADEYVTRLDCLRASVRTCHDVNTDAIIQRDFTDLKVAVEGAGLVWNENAAQEFVNPGYWGRGGIARADPLHLPRYPSL